MIEVCKVVKRFGGVTAVDDASFSLDRNASVVILGASGSGKTTLLRLIAGLELPDRGEVSINGRVVCRPGWGAPPHQHGLSFVFQTPALWPHMTVADNISFGLHGLPAAQAAQRREQMVQDTGLHGLTRRYPAQLSGGQARRVALARALAPRPNWLLMDEPLTNLDRPAREELLRLIQRVVTACGTGLIYVTHSEDEAEQLATRVLYMSDGRLTEERSA